MKSSTTNYPPYLHLPVNVTASGRVSLPGSKSISNRTLLLAALSEGETEVHDLLASDDTLVMLNALRSLGVAWSQEPIQEGDTRPPICKVQGSNAKFPNRQADLYMGNAGTAIRPLVAVLAVLGGDYSIHGVARMHERPIGDLVEALNQAGAQIAYTGNPGYPPLHIQTGHIHAQQLQVKGNVSSQFLTALLLASPLMAQRFPVQISVLGELISKPYIDITLKLMAKFGVDVENRNYQSFYIPQGLRYRSPGTIYVEGDASSASYFLAAGAITGNPVRVEGVGQHSIQGDIRFADALAQMGAHITMGENWIEACASDGLRGIDIDCLAIPDAAMTLAVAALYAEGPTRLRNIASWRVKETDRISAMACELRRLGAHVEEGADYLVVHPVTAIQPATIATYDDHRMAMCFSLASLKGKRLAGGKICIADPKCVAKTFPDYFKVFAQITHA